jgi:MoaA/NifB/PqqE/SkfB family radical SAM enzyme
MKSLSAIRKDLRFAAGLLARRPFNVLVQVTNRCNLRCSFCDFWPNPAPPSEELTVAEFAELARQLRELGCFLVSIEGGEPFVRDDIVEIVAALSKDHITALFTSGWHMTPERASALWEAGLTHGCVSIDYPDARRHDEKRGLTSTSDRAWEAIAMLKETAPLGGKQVNVMTVLMDSNWRDMERLFQMSAAGGVGHQVTLLSTKGSRRGHGGDRLPPPECGAHMVTLWERYRHVRFFRDYFARIDAFLEGGAMPTCRAGVVGFNVDHVGNVASCIERIDKPVGNLRQHSLAELHRRMASDEEVSRCQNCWTACRGIQQAMGGGGTLANWRDLTVRSRV